MSIDSTPEWQQAWTTEIARRVADIESGKSKLTPWEEVRDRLWKGIDVPPSDRTITHED
jgi:putative addiction module component (TIGR02574 family)